MNLAQSLGVAAAAMALGLSASGVAPAQTMAQIAAEARAHMQPAAIRSAVEDLAVMLEQRYVFPDIATQYAQRLRQRLAAGAYNEASDPAVLAQTLQDDLAQVHPDAHLRVSVAEQDRQGRGMIRELPAEGAFGDDAWLGEGVAYVRINLLPADSASVERMNVLLDRYQNANALILDLRACRGGAVPVMDALLSRLYATPTELVRMDTRGDAGMQFGPPSEQRAAPASMRQLDAPSGIRRNAHWAVPTHPVSPLATARVFVLTDRTGSACEHLSMALQSTGRATLVGGTTGGANHYGGERLFAGGRLQVFLPVGRTYDPRTGRDWEGVGITPDRAVAPAEALNVVLADLGVAQSAASAAANAMPAPRRVVQTAPGPRYGIGTEPPRAGQRSVRVEFLDRDLPAATAGVRVGDEIVSLNGRAVADIPQAEFGAALRASPLTLVVERDGRQMTFELSLDASRREHSELPDAYIHRGARTARL